MTQFERLFFLMKKPWFIVFYIMLIILTYQFADKAIAEYFHQFDLRTYGKPLLLITTLGKWILYAPLFILAGLFFRYVRKNPINEHRAWFLLACLLLTNIFSFVLKISLSRSRPDLLFNENLFGFYWFKLNNLYWSFPSGHSITMGSLAAGLSILFPKYFYAFLGLALLVIMTRVFLYFHYLSDVMAGFYLSMLIVGFFAESLKKKQCCAEIM